MTENDKLELLEMLNKASEALQNVIAHDVITYFQLKSGWQEIIQEIIKLVESKGFAVIWKDNKAVKIVEKGDKESEKNIKKNI